MSTITVPISEEQLIELKKLSAKLDVTPEELVRISIEELLTRPEETFQQASDYILKKNAELYRRLAA